MVLQRGLKLSTGCTGSGAFQEVQTNVSHDLCLAQGHQHKLQMDLHVADTCTVNQGQMPLVRGLGPLSEKYEAL